MQNYKTVEETAEDWKISARHVQYLCTTGKIKGAIKRGGSWFIPENTQAPEKKSKNGTNGFKYRGTKEKIFTAAIEMFMQRGFSEVSLRDIAEEVGIRQSTIYNHFKSKQGILDAIYDYYCYHHLKDRPSIEEMEEVLETGDMRKVIQMLRYDYKEDYAKRMSYITKIIFQRLAIDERAGYIGRVLIVEEGIKYVERVFNRGVERKLLPTFDTHAAAVFINSVRIYTLFFWVVDSSAERMAELWEDERTLYDYAASILTELNK